MKLLVAAIAVNGIFPVTPITPANPVAYVAHSAPAEGIIRLKSAYGFDDTVDRIKADVAAKGIRFFDEIDQTALGAEAGIKVGRSTLILFGNPPLGVQFLTSNPYVGLDWPVRMLVTQADDGTVWIAWTDFRFIADRYRIKDRPAQLKMASEVAASIASVATK